MLHREVEVHINEIALTKRRQLRVAEADRLRKQPARIAELKNHVEALQFVQVLLQSTRPQTRELYDMSGPERRQATRYTCKNCGYSWFDWADPGMPDRCPGCDTETSPSDQTALGPVIDFPNLKT